MDINKTGSRVLCTVNDFFHVNDLLKNDNNNEWFYISVIEEVSVIREGKFCIKRTTDKPKEMGDTSFFFNYGLFGLNLFNIVHLENNRKTVKINPEASVI